MLTVTFYDDGTLRLQAGEKLLIPRSPVGMAVKDGILLSPTGATVRDTEICLRFGEQSILLHKHQHRDGSLRLEVADIPPDLDGFVFGPYGVPGAVDFGEYLGAAWLPDGSAVCLQGLNTKTVGEMPFEPVNSTPFPSPAALAAGKSGGTVVLNCFAENMTRPKITAIPGIPRFTADTVPAPEGLITGAAVLLTYGKNAEALLDKIGETELAEGLPHPTVNGEWVKKSPRAKDIYLIFEREDFDEQLRIAQRADIRDIYFSSPFENWGHFDLSRKKYPGGMPQLCAITARAAQAGVRVGFHTLTNFITTNDNLITPVPDDRLLFCDETPLLADITETDTEIMIGPAKNYGETTTLNAVRIGDEIFCYEGYDPDKKVLAGCRRGAFGTVAAAHPKGTPMRRLVDHGYATLFPDLTLQQQMAKRIGQFIRTSQMGRISFDGVEGCTYTGRGEYATAEFVKKVYDTAGPELISDASTCSHYRWHAHAYFNNGEPWYDTDRRGGMFRFRAARQARYRANLIPGMLGWYVIWDADGEFEPTLPQTLESILARTVGFDAGLAFQINARWGENLQRCCDTIRLWQQLRRAHPALPQRLREQLQRQDTHWHLTKDGDGSFVLSRLELESCNLLRVDRNVRTETGNVGYGITQTVGNAHHRALIVLDRGDPTLCPPGTAEPLHIRIRFGTPKDTGEARDLAFYPGYFADTPLLRFRVKARAGEYLEYAGGKTLLHFDQNYNLLETLQGVGQEVLRPGDELGAYTLDYDLDGALTPMLTAISTAESYTLSTPQT